MDAPTLVMRRPSDRRDVPDRRHATDRRRGSDARSAVFEICRSNVHLALMICGSDGEPTKVTTRSLRWRTESTSLYSDASVKELTAAFRTLASEERLAGATAHIALSGEFCVTRVVTGSTDSVRRECSDLEERSHRYLTLGPGRKVIASSVEELDARHQHALLTVTNEWTLETLLEIGDTLGLRIATIESSLVGLSRMQAALRDGCQDACLVVQLDDGSAELGICQGGRLLLDYRPGGHADAGNIADIVAQHLTRVQRYLDRNHTNLKTPVRQVYLAGDAAEVARAELQFKRFGQFQVSVLDPGQLTMDWQYESSVPGPEIAATLGTAMLSEPDGGNRRSPNLLEEILAQSRDPMGPILIRSLLPLAAVLLVAAGLLVLYARERIGTNSLRTQLAELDPARTRAHELQLMLTSADLKLAELRALEQHLPDPNWGRLLTRIAQSMPDDVWLERLVCADARTAVLTGASYADGGIYDFVGYLKQVPGVEEIALQSTGVGHSASGPTTSFDLQLSLKRASDLDGQGVHHD
jgi:Tfp pilus assembly protein PilN